MVVFKCSNLNQMITYLCLTFNLNVSVQENLYSIHTNNNNVNT